MVAKLIEYANQLISCRCRGYRGKTLTPFHYLCQGQKKSAFPKIKLDILLRLWFTVYVVGGVTKVGRLRPRATKASSQPAKYDPALFKSVKLGVVPGEWGHTLVLRERETIFQTGQKVTAFELTLLLPYAILLM